MTAAFLFMILQCGQRLVRLAHLCSTWYWLRQLHSRWVSSDAWCLCRGGGNGGRVGVGKLVSLFAVSRPPGPLCFHAVCLAGCLDFFMGVWLPRDRKLKLQRVLRPGGNWHSTLSAAFFWSRQVTMPVQNQGEEQSPPPPIVLGGVPCVGMGGLWRPSW